jgi:hypothetical protein
MSSTNINMMGKRRVHEDGSFMLEKKDENKEAK